MTGSEIRIIRLLFSYHRVTSFTGMTVDMILTSSEEQTREFEMKHPDSKMKPLSLPTIRRALKKLVENGLVGNGIKKETYKKTYYLTEDGVAFVHKMADASKQLDELQNGENK